MDSVKAFLTDSTNSNMIINGVVVAIGMAVAITSFALLVPLDSVQAVTGVTIITAVAYALSFLAWMIVLVWYKNDDGKSLIWLLTHMMFLVLLPATISATAMNVTTVQNTRNLMASKISN